MIYTTSADINQQYDCTGTEKNNCQQDTHIRYALRFNTFINLKHVLINIYKKNTLQCTYNVNRTVNFSSTLSKIDVPWDIC